MDHGASWSNARYIIYSSNTLSNHRPEDFNSPPTRRVPRSRPLAAHLVRCLVVAGDSAPNLSRLQRAEKAGPLKDSFEMITQAYC